MLTLSLVSRMRSYPLHPLGARVAIDKRRGEPTKLISNLSIALTELLKSKAAQASAITRTSSVRGPWTPSTRDNSMSEVADGPETKVTGRSILLSVGAI